jgi:hypothetical protein
MRTDLFGTVYKSPIFTFPASGEKFLEETFKFKRRSLCLSGSKDSTPCSELLATTLHANREGFQHGQSAYRFFLADLIRRASSQ